jgi:hypothetical protein
MQNYEQTTARPLVKMHLPEFVRGYQSGLKQSEPCLGPLTDEDLIDALKAFDEEGLFREENEESLQWHVGRLLGQISRESAIGQQGIAVYTTIVMSLKSETPGH